MNKFEFIGMLVILGIPSSLSLMSLIKPIMNLTNTITVLSENVRNLHGDNKRQDERIAKHGIEIDDLKTGQAKIEAKTDGLEKRMERFEYGKK